MEAIAGARENGYRVADLRAEPIGEPPAEKYVLAAGLEPFAVNDTLGEAEHTRLALRVDADKVHPHRAVLRIRIETHDELAAEHHARGGGDSGRVERLEQPFRLADGEVERPLLAFVPVAGSGYLRTSGLIMGQIHIRFVRHALQHRIHSDEDRKPAGSREAGNDGAPAVSAEFFRREAREDSSGHRYALRVAPDPAAGRKQPVRSRGCSNRRHTSYPRFRLRYVLSY